MKLQHLRRGEEHVIWLASMEAPRSCILLYGNAEARPFNLTAAPVLNFTEGSIVGNLGVSPQMPTHQSKASRMNHALSSTTATAATLGVSDSKWRRIKRKNTLRSDIHLYNKVTILGPADYIVLTESDVRETGSGAADRLQWAKMFGIEKFVGCLRQTVFESGATIVREGHQLSHLYFIVEGECRASVQRDDTNTLSTIQSIDASLTSSKPLLTSAEAQLRHARKFRSSDVSQLPVASLGPKSTVGDISLVLGIPEPTTIRAVTTVHVLSLAQEDFLRESSDRHDPVAKTEHCDQRFKIDSLRDILRHKQPVSFVDKQSSSAGVANGQTSRVQSSAGAFNTGAAPHVTPLPSVVLKHAAVNAEDRKQHTRNQFATGSVAAISGEDVTAAPESPTRLTRQQRKAARAFTNLQYPVAAKCLGDCVQMPMKTTIVDMPPRDQTLQTASDDLLFLFPTITRRRQLHGK
ncbi:unnamed protein product [Phytophthora fragariaefolia]|uniref:Unnamed protein product n=1 Tax=Phytophthora fragariaefolia TaxID=1490495 RepID=A0A9W6TN02_9STRA|nr:unnamed protein product [Phytophthora fragariaefolia]